MAKYRYMFVDLLTDEVSVELPLYGTSFTRRICKAGEFNGTMALNTAGYSNEDIINGTIPGRHGVFVERNNQLVWGGIIWTRTWQEQSKTFQYYGQSFESIFDNWFLEKTYKSVNKDQRDIVIDMIEMSQLGSNQRKLGIGVPPRFGNVGTLRSVNFFDYEAWTYGKILEYMANYNDGLDWYIDVYYDNDGERAKMLKVDDRLGLPIDRSVTVFDYPGAIKNFWYPENANKAATGVVAIGSGEGTKMLRTVERDPSDAAKKLVEHLQTFSDKDIKVPATLTSKAKQLLSKNRSPVVVPTFEIYSDREPLFGSYNLGDYVKFKLTSERFIDPVDVMSRIVGWDVKPTEAGDSEDVKLITALEETDA